MQLPDLIVTRVDIAEMLGVTKQRITKLQHQPGFPKPISTINGGRGLVWYRRDIEDFNRRWKR